jgi:VWFA-related protein
MIKHVPTITKRVLMLVGVLSFLTLVRFAVSGQQDPAKVPATDDVLRINTELVQTIVTVSDKKGHFVDGLNKESFELRVNGQTLPISFFENIVSGSQRDRTVGVSTSKEARSSHDQTHELSSRQRTIIFFVDDRHLSLESVNRTRKTLANFIDKQMGQNDLVAIASSSGQIGFLQQFTDEKDVLRAAVARINHVPYVVSDYAGNTGSRMTENMALSIERKDDPNVFEFYVQDCLKLAPRGVTRQERATVRRQCEVEVQNRARQILVQAGAVTSETYYSLETLLDSAEHMPGSKLAFFLSDGFLADTGPRGRIATNQLNRLTDKARRAGVVIYTIHTRGVISGALDATGTIPFDPNGRLDSANAREIAASQDALNALAVDTGGRALRNQNFFDGFINDAVAETSRYYLLAWRPERNDEKSETFKKIEIAVVGRSDLTVRLARSFVVNRTADLEKTKHTPGEQKSSLQREPNEDAALRKALNDFYAQQALPLQLSLMYLDTPLSGIVLTSSVQLTTALLSFGEENKDPAQVSLAGVVLNDRGKSAATFKTQLTLNPSSFLGSDSSLPKVIYNFRSALKPGIYQVRVAGRDNRTGRLGSAMEWIVIPDFSNHQLSLSSLILGIENVMNKDGNEESVQWSVDKRFAKESRLKFLVFIYNTSQPVNSNLAMRLQVFRDGQSIISTPVKIVSPDKHADPRRVPVNEEINLSGFQPGRYLLVVSVEDRATQKIALQQTVFYVH